MTTSCCDGLGLNGDYNPSLDNHDLPVIGSRCYRSIRQFYKSGYRSSGAHIIGAHLSCGRILQVNLHKTTIVCECYWGTQCTSKHVGFITTIRLKNIWNYVIGKPKHFMCIEWQCNYLLVNYHLNSAEILLVVWNNTPQMIFIPKCVLWINSKQLPFSIFLWDILGYSTHIVISVKIQDSYPCVCVCVILLYRILHFQA